MSAENSSASPAVNFEKCTVVILDVAGTTTAIDFIKDTLFKYATENIEAFLKEKWEESTVKEAIKDLKDGELDLAAAVELVKELTEKNDDNKGLKALQGMIYEKGYTSGAIKAHVFDDVSSCLESWAKVRKVAIYSTGSVDAQKLLFAHTTDGDLTIHITKYFDQSVVGLKTEKESYEKIAKELEVAPENVLFVSDNVEEVKAAKSAGLLVAVVERPGNAAIAEETKAEFSVVASFKDLSFENPAKRKIDDEPTTTEEPPTKVAKTESTEEKTETEATAVETPAETAETMEVDAATETDNTASKESSVEASTEKTESTSTDKMETAEETKETKEETATENGDAKQEETKTENEAVVEEKAEEEKKEVAAVEEQKEKVEEADETAKKTEDVAVAEEKSEADAAQPVVAEDKPEETKVTDETVDKAEEAKPEGEVEVAAEAKESEETPESNGTTEPVENGKHEEEKENNAELANGIENGKSDNGTDEEKENGEEATKAEESEIKVKKLDDPVDSTPVAVEA